jgi:hypothetical protein
MGIARRVINVFREEGFAGIALRVCLGIVRHLHRVASFLGSTISQTYFVPKEKYADFEPLIDRHALDSLLANGPRLCDCSVERLLAHEFDLLGSGWVSVGRSQVRDEVAGARGHPEFARDNLNWRNLVSRIGFRRNSPRAAALRSLLDSEYRLIDWCVDFKSGYRWDSATHYLLLNPELPAGVDIKVPWELARMQHLLYLAAACAEREASSGDSTKQLSKEVQNQILDFISNNPPRYGVNWACPMDVALRAVNWVVAVSVLKATNHPPNADFMRAFSASLVDHGRHVFSNLEWSPIRGNHYLTHLCGLIFIAAALPGFHESRRWWRFAVRALQREVLVQFGSDGGHWEGATGYHRYCTDALLYSTAVVLGNFEKFQDFTRRGGRTPDAFAARHVELAPEFLTRLRSAVRFLNLLIKPITGQIPQIGDFDSGYFLLPHVIPTHHRACTRAKDKALLWCANPGVLGGHLDGVSSLEVASSIGCGPDAATRIILDTVEQPRNPWAPCIASALSRGRQLPPSPVGDDSVPACEGASTKPSQTAACADGVGRGPSARVTTFPIPAIGCLRDLSLQHFRHFGLVVWRSPRFFLSLRCVQQPPAGPKGHFHDDQLSVELEVDGVSFTRDPGTFVYTPDVELRNHFRSRDAHFSPVTEGGDAHQVFRGVFQNVHIRPATVVHLGLTGAEVQQSLEAGALVGIHISIEPMEVRIGHYAHGVGLSLRSKGFDLYSPGYGILVGGGL